MMVVKRSTCNKGKTHCTPVVPRVQPLLKCTPSRSHPLVWISSGHHTARSLRLDDSHHNCITELIIHQQQRESHELLPVAARAPTKPNGGGGAGLTQL
jgi:hypothetical protein